MHLFGERFQAWLRDHPVDLVDPVWWTWIKRTRRILWGLIIAAALGWLVEGFRIWG